MLQILLRIHKLLFAEDKSFDVSNVFIWLIGSLYQLSMANKPYVCFISLTGLYCDHCSLQILSSLLESPYFFIDVLYVHELPSEVNLCKVSWTTTYLTCDQAFFSFFLFAERTRARRERGREGKRNAWYNYLPIRFPPACQWYVKTSVNFQNLHYSLWHLYTYRSLEFGLLTFFVSSAFLMGNICCIMRRILKYNRAFDCVFTINFSPKTALTTIVLHHTILHNNILVMSSQWLWANDSMIPFINLNQITIFLKQKATAVLNVRFLYWLIVWMFYMRSGK